jgi:hypothetical protein
MQRREELKVDDAVTEISALLAAAYQRRARIGVVLVTPDQNYTASFNLIASFGACARSCLVPRYRSVVWTDECPSNN